MKAEERDKLLIKLDERTSNIWRAVEKIETHQEEQNGFTKEVITNCAKNTAWRKAHTWIIGLIIAGVITNVLGLW